jgi:arylsulfatase A-like enzyme
MMVRKGADRMNRDFLDWSAGAETPYFAFLNLYDAHDPYEPAVEFDRFGPGRTRNDPWIEPSGYSDLELDQERAAYHGAIAQLDHALGALVASLEARGDLENTVVIVTSDHGEEFAEHADVMGHGGSLYLPSVHVPLVMRWDAGIAGGSVVADPVSLRDLAPTILEFAGLTNTPFAGPSLASRWTDGANASADAFALSTVRYRKLPDAYPLTLGDLVSVSVGDFHYILNGDGSEELFDWRTDPFSTHDIAGDPAVESVLGRARRIACGQVSVGGCAEHPPHNESPTGTPK